MADPDDRAHFIDVLAGLGKFVTFVLAAMALAFGDTQRQLQGIGLLLVIVVWQLWVIEDRGRE